MSFRLPKGRNAPPDLNFDPCRPQPPGLHDMKLAAWALAVGAAVPLAWPATDRRPHRGELADVDMSTAGPDPGARPLLRRLTGWLRPGAGVKAVAAVSGRDPDAIGASPQIPYTGGKPVA